MEEVETPLKDIEHLRKGNDADLLYESVMGLRISKEAQVESDESDVSSEEFEGSISSECDSREEKPSKLKKHEDKEDKKVRKGSVKDDVILINIRKKRRDLIRRQRLRKKESKSYLNQKKYSCQGTLIKDFDFCQLRKSNTTITM
jgi:hypothetical protein